MLAFTTPRQFFAKAWPRIIDADNGLADRILFMFQKKVERDLEEMAGLAEQLEAFLVTSLNVVLEQIFVERKCPRSFFQVLKNAGDCHTIAEFYTGS